MFQSLSIQFEYTVNDLINMLTGTQATYKLEFI